MGSETQSEIPVINFCDESMKSGSDSWKSARERIRNAFEEYSCFEVTHEGLPTELRSSVFGAAKQLFDLPSETKGKKASEMLGPAYIPPNPLLPRYESIRIESPNNLKDAQRFTNIIWPQGNDTFCEAIHSFGKQLGEIYETTLTMLLESYGQEKLLDFFKEASIYNFVLIKNIEGKSEEINNVGLAAHTDNTLMTVLHQHQVEGLQVKTKSGLWIDVKPSPSSFLVIAGDALMVWSNARITSCEHRVIVDDNKERYSTGLFLVMKEVIQVPEELVDDDHPLLYKPFNHIEYTVYKPANDPRSDILLKEFCGI